MLALAPARPAGPSRTVMAFVAIYVAAALLLVGLLIIKTRGDDAAPPTVTATDTDGHSIGVATVFLDGREICGVLPCRLHDVTGRHWVSIRADGYAPADPIEADGDGAVHFTLRSTHAAAPAPEPAPVASASPAPSHSAEVAKLDSLPPAPEPAPRREAPVRSGPARLSFYAHPSAVVLLDGRPLGSTPRPGVIVSPGAHTVLFVHDGRRVGRSATAVAGRNVGVSARF